MNLINCPLVQQSFTETNVAHLEALLNYHSKISDSAVIGIRDESTGNDLICAYVVRTDASLTAEAVKLYVAQNASDFKKLRGGVVFVDKILKVHVAVSRLISVESHGKNFAT